MSSRSRQAASALSLMLAGLLAPAAAHAHAAEVRAEIRRAVAVEARYDTGEPMAEAQVTVFAPDDPASAWLQGATDAAGRFVFVPDGQAGYWSVRVRQAGHGAIAHVELGADLEAGAGEVVRPLMAQAAGGPDLAQKLVMAATVVWGCIGTALYFRRGRA